MSKKTLQDLKVDAHIAVLHTKVDSLLEKQKELTARVRANERVVAIVSAIGIGAGGIVGTTAFAPAADAREPVQWNYGSVVNKLREWKLEKERSPIEDALNNALADWEIQDGSNGSAEQEIVLQLSSDGDYESTGWRHD